MPEGITCSAVDALTPSVRSDGAGRDGGDTAAPIKSWVWLSAVTESVDETVSVPGVPSASVRSTEMAPPPASPCRACRRKLNTDEDPELAAQYGVYEFPAVAMFKGGEVAVADIVGGPHGTLRYWISEALASLRT